MWLSISFLQKFIFRGKCVHCFFLFCLFCTVPLTFLAFFQARKQVLYSWRCKRWDFHNQAMDFTWPLTEFDPWLLFKNIHGRKKQWCYKSAATNFIPNEEWSSQLWSQSPQSRKEAWKKFRTSTGHEPVTSRYRCDALPTELWSHRYREVTGSSPVEVLNFFQASLRNCKNCDHNCEDHSSFEATDVGSRSIVGSYVPVKDM